MKKLLFLLGFIFFFFNAEAQELAYAETNTDLPAMTNIKFTVSSIYRDSLFWFMDVDIRPIEGSWKTSATVDKFWGRPPSLSCFQQLSFT
jgi:hypothetical protein